MLFILASQKKVAEFEKATRDFMSLNKNSASWEKIKEMRRSLERDKPLSADDSTSGTDVVVAPPQFLPGKRRLIGKILVETGVLSALDMKKYLEDFDPKLDGRIGEYLVARQAISNEQLNEALLQQHGSETTATQQPTDDDIGRFLPDSSSKRDVRLDEYMKMDIARSNKPKKP